MADSSERLIGMASATVSEADAKAEAEADAFLATRIAQPVSDGERRSPGGKAEDGAGESARSEAKSDKERDEHGRFKSTNPDAEKKPAKSKDTTEPAAVPDGVNPDDYRKALKALHRDGVPSKTLESMEPQELVAWGIKRAGAQAEGDRLGNEVAKLRSTKKDESAKPDSAKEPEPDYAALLEPLKAAYGDEIAEPLAQLAKQIHENATKGVDQREERLAKVEARIVNQERDAARNRLADKFSLQDEARWNRVLDRRESDKNDYDGEYEALAAACRIEFADEIIAEYEAKLKGQHELRAKGQSTPQTRTEPVKAKTQDEQETDLLDAIFDGDMDRVHRIAKRTAHPSDSMLMAS